MSKRFVDCRIWEDEWYSRLPVIYKLFWKYICERCDGGGLWKPNHHIAGLLMGDHISDKQALELFNTGKERIKVMEDGNWFITGFIDFQFPNGVKRGVNFFNPVYAVADKYKIDLTEWEARYTTWVSLKGSPRVGQGLVKGCPTHQDKDKIKDSSLTLCIKSSGDQLAFDQFWMAYPSSRAHGGSKQKAIEAWSEMAPPLKDCLIALKWQIRSKDWTKDGGQFIPSPATWLLTRRWEDRNPVAERPAYNGGC